MNRMLTLLATMRTCRPDMPRHFSWLPRLYLPGLRRGGGHDGCMTQDLPPRATDIFRHLSDLRSGTYEGARPWPERVEVVRRAVSLLDPVVRRVLEQANAVFVRGSGTIHYGPGTIAMAEPAHTGNCPGPSSGTLPPAKAGALSRYR